MGGTLGVGWNPRSWVESSSSYVSSSGLFLLLVLLLILLLLLMLLLLFFSFFFASYGRCHSMPRLSHAMACHAIWELIFNSNPQDSSTLINIC